MEIKMKKVMILATLVAMGIFSGVLDASDSAWSPSGPIYSPEDPGDAHVYYNDVYTRMSSSGDPFTRDTADWYEWQVLNYSDNAASDYGVQQDLAGQYVQQRKQEKAERRRFWALSPEARAAELATVRAREVAAMEAQAARVAAQELLLGQWRAQEAVRAAKAAEAPAATEMEKSSSTQKTPKKRWWKRAYEFFDGTPEQKEAHRQAKVEKVAIQAAQEAERLKRAEVAFRAEQGLAEREYNRNRARRAYIRECRDNGLPVYSVYE